jgi:transcriptional regulator with XRE-family HTH domain
MRSTYSARYRRLLARLREARLQAGLTQSDVAKAVRRTQSFISKCESGERRTDIVELEELAGIYGKPLAFFVAEAEAPPAGGASLSADRRRSSRPRRKARRGARHPR